MQAELRETCRQLRTTLAIGVLTAYVGLVLRWCNTSESVIRYASDGRDRPDIANTIGFFASTLHLRVRLNEADSFVDLTSRIMAEYCKAYEHADCSYIASRADCAEFTRNTAFNWLPHGSCGNDLADLEGSVDALTASPVPFGYPLLKNLELDREAGLLLYDTADGIIGDLYFPLNRFSVGAMERFARTFLRFTDALLRRPGARVQDISMQ